jgi:hypothetical protein
MLDYKNSMSLTKLTKKLSELKPNKFKKILKNLNMDLNINQNDNSLWKAIKLYLAKEYPNPTYESVYYLRKNKLTNNPNSLALMAKADMVRTIGTPPKFAVEDIMEINKLMNLVEKAESVEIQGDVIYQGQKKYKVLDNHKKNMPLTKHQIDVFEYALQNVYNNYFDFVPKELTLDEKIEWIKSNHDRK